MQGNEAEATRPPSWHRVIPGVALGCATALIGLLYFLVAGLALGPWLLRPSTRESALAKVAAGARRLADGERTRRSVFFGDRFPEHYKASDRKILRYVLVRGYTGLLSAVVTGLLGVGLILAGVLVMATARGTVGWQELLLQVLLGCVLLFLDIQGLYALAVLDTRLARECFGPSEWELLRRRIDELSTSRAGVVRAVDAERRRIERDLHDGVQQRLVALAMLIGRARRSRTRDPEQADVLLLQAHEAAQDALTELREAAWRVYPSALDSQGLREALGGVAERCAIPLRMEYEVEGPLPQPAQTAAYFVVSESVTNAAKHSGATHISVRLARHGPVLVLRIEDNGTGGADPAGGGLTGLRSRVGALDGVLHIESPLGGPTTITAELPCV
ncbi:sensor histidine kinase [Streptomyces cyaneochromogenes]|uniref:sensor histidine kinase n=1 Tax=Streptomyces cyaneochromogenes TaxID=2496836 RepID=UPI001E4A8D1E|nr:sensor histidine kinase [Streptomyces cyaneochromogenes]